MDWTADVKSKLRRKNQLLFCAKDAYLQDLIALIGEQSHRTVVLWAEDLAQEAVNTLEERYPQESRPRAALEAARLWSSGKIKMPAAQRAILACHAAAKELSAAEDSALCHAVGQACSVVHTAGHAIGFPLYDLTAIVRRLGIDNSIEAVEKRKQEYIENMIYWAGCNPDDFREWADFMTK